MLALGLETIGILIVVMANAFLIFHIDELVFGGVSAPANVEIGQGGQGYW